jgi:hypothetical protein
MTRVTFLLLALIASGCSYDVSFHDCEFTCNSKSDCPDGFDCLANLCRTNNGMGDCTMPGSVTLRQTADDKVDRNLVFACTNGDQTTAATSWYRLFSLADAGVTTSFQVDHATLGVCFTVSQPTVFVKLYTYTGTLGANTLDLSKASQVQSTTVGIPETQITELVDAKFPPGTVIPPGSNVLLEIQVPDLNLTGQQINIGSTDSTESQPGYFLAPLCGTTTPTSTKAANHPDVRFVLTLTGLASSH